MIKILSQFHAIISSCFSQEFFLIFFAAASLNNILFSGDLLSSVASVLRQVLGGQQDDDEDYLEENEGSGEASGAGAENDSFHVDIAEDSFLDWVFNIIPDTVNSITGGEEYDYEYVYDEDNRQGMNISTKVGLF